MKLEMYIQVLKCLNLFFSLCLKKSLKILLKQNSPAGLMTESCVERLYGNNPFAFSFSSQLSFLYLYITDFVSVGGTVIVVDRCYLPLLQSRFLIFP